MVNECESPCEKPSRSLPNDLYGINPAEECCGLFVFSCWQDFFFQLFLRPDGITDGVTGILKVLKIRFIQTLESASDQVFMGIIDEFSTEDL